VNMSRASFLRLNDTEPSTIGAK